MKTHFCLFWVAIWGQVGLLAGEPAGFSIGGEPREPANQISSPTQTETEPPRRTQWLVFSAPWCEPCRQAKADFESWFRRSGWQLDETPQAHFRFVDVDLRPELAKQYRIAKYPTFVLLHAGEERLRHEGYPGRDRLARDYLQTANARPPAVGAISIGEWKGQRERVARLIETFRAMLGRDGKLTLRWERGDSLPVTIPWSDTLSFQCDTPLVMTYELHGDVLTCRFSEPYPRGRFQWGLKVEHPVTAVKISVREIEWEIPNLPNPRILVIP